MFQEPRRPDFVRRLLLGIVVVIAPACAPREQIAEAPDTLQVGDLSVEELQDRCQQQTFGGTPAETMLKTGATVRIMSHVAGPGTSIGQLASGRFVARLENTSDTAAHPHWALRRGGQSCWHILTRGNRLVAQYVALDTAWVVPDTTLVIEFHGSAHTEPRARFERKPPRDSVGQAAPSQLLRSQTGVVFLPAAFRTILQLEDEAWGWYTCASNGCCRSMQ